ncbi:cytochrome P450 4V2 [Trichonephila clavata]|uniref:Cytochrome P450 4V2 n=1 Tax=Trichonephila clavata TaxID=2740835 RepID=A0A8X6LTW8_TRICU|nr:cytochrome P450 4V2 [Trichonephila clavata]
MELTMIMSSPEPIKDQQPQHYGVWGHETIALTITWALYLIGLHPDVQAKLYEETERVFGKDRNRYVTERDLNDLKYLDCVLKLVQHLQSMGFYLELVSSILGGYTLPKDSHFHILIEFLHKDKDVFPDPDRFLPENSIKIPECAYMPFSVGPRNCIGVFF